MRLFHVLPEYLSSPLLLRQHQTCHLLLTAIAEKRTPGGMARYQNHAGFVVWMHWLCTQEMAMRGKNHLSPIADLWYAASPARRLLDIFIPTTRITLDIADLKVKYDQTNAANKYWDSTKPFKTCGTQLAMALTLATARGVQNSWLTT